MAVFLDDPTVTTVIVSGGFDPIHVGHLRMMQEAKALGDRLLVIVNNDNWLKVKKGYCFMSQEDRKEIILGFDCVDDVVLTSHVENTTDKSVCNDLMLIYKNSVANQHFNGRERFLFANGGDRKDDNVPEVALCAELGIEMAFNVGGGKLRSSSDLVREASEFTNHKG